MQSQMYQQPTKFGRLTARSRNAKRLLSESFPVFKGMLVVRLNSQVSNADLRPFRELDFDEFKRSGSHKVRGSNLGARTIYWKDEYYASRSEAACAEMLSKYVPGFKIREGLTHEVPLAPNQQGDVPSVDFRVGGIFIEFHPPRIKSSSSRSGKRKYGDFDSPKEYFDYRHQMDSIHDSKHRAQFKEQTEQFLTDRYFQRRYKMIESRYGEIFQGLVVAANEMDFYHQVLKPLAGANCPSYERFEAEYRQVQRSARDLRGSRRR